MYICLHSLTGFEQSHRLIVFRVRCAGAILAVHLHWRCGWHIFVHDLNGGRHVGHKILDARTFRLMGTFETQIALENVDQYAAEAIAHILEAVIQVRPEIFCRDGRMAID